MFDIRFFFTDSHLFDSQHCMEKAETTSIMIQKSRKPVLATINY